MKKTVSKLSHHPVLKGRGEGSKGGWRNDSNEPHPPLRRKDFMNSTRFLVKVFLKGRCPGCNLSVMPETPWRLVQVERRSERTWRIQHLAPECVAKLEERAALLQAHVPTETQRKAVHLKLAGKCMNNEFVPAPSESDYPSPSAAPVKSITDAKLDSTLSNSASVKVVL